MLQWNKPPIEKKCPGRSATLREPSFPFQNYKGAKPSFHFLNYKGTVPSFPFLNYKGTIPSFPFLNYKGAMPSSPPQTRGAAPARVGVGVVRGHAHHVVLAEKVGDDVHRPAARVLRVGADVAPGEQRESRAPLSAFWFARGEGARPRTKLALTPHTHTRRCREPRAVGAGQRVRATRYGYE